MFKVTRAGDRYGDVSGKREGSSVRNTVSTASGSGSSVFHPVPILRGFKVSLSLFFSPKEPVYLMSTNFISTTLGI